MIVVVGSRHDPRVGGLVSAWGAKLCSAEDLVAPGWAWGVGGAPRTWRIDGARVDDDAITGVFVRRSSVYADELVTIHHDDRAYLAAEAQAFLGCVLGTTGARACNRAVDGAFGEEVVRLDRWLAAAVAANVPVRPLEIASRTSSPSIPNTKLVEVVGGEPIGALAATTRDAAAALARALAADWIVCGFDRKHQVVSVTTARAPSSAAIAALGALLGSRP